MKRFLALSALALLAVAVPAQTKYSLVMNGRFDFISLDPNGGSLNTIREFDLGIVTPGPGAAARSWLPTTAFNALWGDAHADNNYTRFNGWKTYFERFNFAGPFIKHADRVKGDPKLIYFTIRDNGVNKTFKVFTNGGTKTHQVRTGDFFRFLPGGNIEFFITQDLLMKALGTQTGAYTPGAHAICQDALGNLYFSPAEGGVRAQGFWFNDGAIIMLEAKDITYDAQGNVQDVVANSAFGIYGEVQAGPNAQPHIRGMVTAAAALDYKGNAITSTANMVALDLDPNGGTQIASIPHPVSQKYYTVPNFIFSFDNGGWGGTIFSTKNAGSIAVINGVTMGTKTGVADGSYLGCKGVTASYTPTFMGFCWVHEVQHVFTADAPNDGAILAADTNVQIDVGYLPPSTPVILLMAAGPRKPGQFLTGYDLSSILGQDSFGWTYTFLPPVFTFVLGTSSVNGYAQFKVPKPTGPEFIGVNLVFHAAKINKFAGPPASVSNPVLMQFK